MLKITKNIFRVYLLILICLIGRETHAQSDSFGVTYPTLNSHTFIDVEYSSGEFLLGLTGDYSLYDLLLIDANNYQVIDSLSLDKYNFELVDLYENEDGFRLTGVNIFDSTLYMLEIEIENNIITIIPKLQNELPPYFMEGFSGANLPYTIILETISYKGQDFGCISNSQNSILFKIFMDTILFQIPAPALFLPREVKVIDQNLVIPSFMRVSWISLNDLRTLGSLYDPMLFKNSGWIYSWESIYIFADQLNSQSILASQVLINFFNDDFSLIKVDTIGHQDSANFNGFNNPVSFYNDSNNIYVSGSLGGWFNEEFRTFTNSFYLTSYNKTLEQDWFLELSNDANYAMNGVLTLENDNALIYGYEGREDRNWKAYPFLIEIDKEGFVVSSTNSIEHRKEDIIILYPNPVADFLYYKIGKGVDLAFDITIYDQSGKQALFQAISSEQQRINVSTLPAGLYYLSLTKDGKRWATRKFVKL